PGDSTAQVAGVGMPARASRKLVADLSTQRSMARASLMTGTPLSRNACRIPSRRVTASKLPPAMERTRTALGRRWRKPAIRSPDRLAVSNPHASSCTQTARAPKPASALPSSRACQSRRSVISAIDSEEAPPSAASASPECRIEQTQFETTGVEALAGFERGDDDRGRREQHRIDGVEILIEARENFREWAAVIAGAPAGPVVGKRARG